MSASSTGSPAGSSSVEMLTHNKVQLALHHLQTSGSGRPLLILHGLGEHTGADVPPWAASWDGPIAGLDFTGHGQSTIPPGGGYNAEILLADADIALAALAGDDGKITVAGRGLGAYIALMLAGARAPQVHGAVLMDGIGLTGGATGPTSGSFVLLPPSATPPDPYALFEMSRDLRPPDYATHFVRLAVEASGLDEPIAVCGITRPPWLATVVDEVGVITCTIDEALRLYA
jgi:pimeloyl-ACP methyl ester carboxylesterase